MARMLSGWVPSTDFSLFSRQALYGPAGCDTAGRRFVRSGLETIEDKIAQTVNDGPAAIMFYALCPMGMGADHRIGTSIDQPTRQLSLALIGLGFTLPAPVHARNDHVGVGSTRRADVLHHAVVFAPGDAWLVRPGFEKARLEFVVRQ